MGQIASAAGAAKPKLYRHFSDKTDLYNAIVDRIGEMLWERIMSRIDLTHDSATDLVRRGATEYAAAVGEHPNVFRFIAHSHFTQHAGESERALQSARGSARRAAKLVAGVADTPVDVDSAELVVYSMFGAVASATDWWLGAQRATSPPMAVAEFVEYLTAIVAALMQTSARVNGIAVDPDAPLYRAFSAG